MALFVTSPCQGVTLHPALRSPDFPLCRREIPAVSGCLADSRTRFYPARAQEYAFSMRRRLYFLLPDVESARHTADDLLLARVEDRHMHFLARRGTDLGELHEASYLFKTDLLHGAGVGLMLGGIGGLILGAIIVAYPPEGTQPQLVAVLIAAIVGGILGAWMASMAAAAVPNSRLKAFHEDIERGKVLLMVDVPYGRIEQIREVVLSRHPEAVAGGLASRYPAFP